MEINETAVLNDRGFVQISGDDAKDFLQNIVTNDIEKVSDNLTIFSSILTPQGKYLYEFFVLKMKDGYLLECEKDSTLEIIKIFTFYKLRSKIKITDASEQYTNIVISLEKFKEVTESQNIGNNTISYKNVLIYTDARNKNLGARILSKTKNPEQIINDFNLKLVNKEKYYEKSFNLGIPQINLSKLKDKIFGIENNLDELGAIDFKKGCYVGQENTSRIKLRNKLRRRILPIKKISGEFFENDTIEFKKSDIGKIIIDKPFAFGLIKIVEPNLKEFVNTELICGKSKVKIFKPDWM